jgi:hypothetical protein
LSTVAAGLDGTGQIISDEVSFPINPAERMVCKIVCKKICEHIEGKGKEAVCRLVTSVVCEHVGADDSNGIEERSAGAVADPLESLSMDALTLTQAAERENRLGLGLGLGLGFFADPLESLSMDPLTQAAEREKFFAMHEELVRERERS